ncbi:hypothetical protein XH89_20065 [Bradyrhizobium sp. CCBAU 53340]|uniref:hypothetical protein n=1 Tax=Bradyrhizobium sp. CCBAU 53340 TaxID=1325112 RepID=UPI001889D3DB|nr:hypothetical protein [Bradyrhizobium sp. CCBAU 53340]QOZ45523.1 hypothetical protein XH89_20065 [Bradyrhizobium sp. CCBAU 53340]
MINDTSPEPNSGLIHREPGIIIAYDDETGPRGLAPYFPNHRPDGSINHGFVDLADKPELVKTIPEVADSPAYQELLIAINRPGSTIMSIGCERGSFESSYSHLPRQVSSYTDVVLRDLEQNGSKDALIGVAHRIAAAFKEEVEGQAQILPHEIQLIVERLKLLFDIDQPWALNIKLFAYGRNEAEAFDHFEWVASLAAQAIFRL